MKKNIAETVRSLVEKPLCAAGFSLWNVRYEKEGQDYVLLIEVDRDSGVDMDACSAANDIVEPIVDSADPIEGPYCLEVASAGMYRELLKPEHFAAATAINAEVSLKTFMPVDGKKEFAGRLDSADDVTITVSGTIIDKKNIAKMTATFE